MNTILILGLLLTSSVIAAESCSTAQKPLSAAERKMYARSISSNLAKWQPPAQIKIQKTITVSTWTAVWATPAGAEQGIFLYSQEKSGLVFHDVWGGSADHSEKASIVDWVRKLSPPPPDSFAQCFADAVVTH